MLQTRRRILPATLLRKPMKESNPQLMVTTDSAGAPGRESADNSEVGAEPYGSFVALKRLTKLDVEAVRMQGCADGGSACIEPGGKK